MAGGARPVVEQRPQPLVDGKAAAELRAPFEKASELSGPEALEGLIEAVVRVGLRGEKPVAAQTRERKRGDCNGGQRFRKAVTARAAREGRHGGLVGCKSRATEQGESARERTPPTRAPARLTLPRRHAIATPRVAQEISSVPRPVPCGMPPARRPTG